MSAPKLYATSTIAMSAYNVLAACGDPMTATQILDALSLQHPGLEISQLLTALARLVKLNLIIRRKKAYQSIDVQRRVVLKRDHTDAKIDPKTGNVKGGWNGWLIGRLGSPKKTWVSIFEVVR